MHQRVTEFAALVDRSRRFRSGVTRDAAGERELPEQTSQTIGILTDIRIDLAVGTFQVGVRDHAWAAVTGPANVNDVEIHRTDGTIEVSVDKI